MKYSYKPADTVIKLSSRFRGVSWDKRKSAWRASISENGRKKILGYFDNEESAAHCYNEAAKKLGRDFLNILPQ
ncbi:MAG TPA: AP2/ERF family transcription factor [Candidatus Sulfotelmatobacter sp.]|nr:AP2/ERF family transcription factor [Candidatus Sulfotelmatobacter sp.]